MPKFYVWYSDATGTVIALKGLVAVTPMVASQEAIMCVPPGSTKLVLLQVVREQDIPGVAD